MELNDDYEVLEAAVELQEDYQVLSAEARSQVRSLNRLIERTTHELNTEVAQAEPNAGREASFTTALVRLAEQKCVWEGRAAVYAHYARIAARRRIERTVEK